MKRRRRLWQIFGPLIVAAVAITMIMVLPISFKQANSKTVEKAATSLSANVLKGESLKDQAMSSSGNYVPFIGSSELSRMDPFHPSILAKKYHRDYQPLLLGAPGTQSLTHFFSVNGMSASLRNKKAVVIISPQWFVRKGVQPNMFSFYYSPLQTTTFLEHAKNNAMDRYAAKRLLQMPSGTSDSIIHQALLQVAVGLPLTNFQKFYIQDIKGNALKTQDDVFSRLFLKDRERYIQKGLKHLPSKYNFTELDDLAGQLGAGETGSNPFEVKDSFYSRRIEPLEPKLKGSQRHFNYQYGPEYSDFQLLLNKFSQLHMDVLFVIPPVNYRWAEYTGLPQKTLRNFDRKITYQLRSQGFNNIDDMTNDDKEDYFMQDTIHLGWRGWLDLDQEVKPFLETTKAAPQNYQIKQHFYTKAWQKTPAKAVPNMVKTAD
ncbi:D-alanyl-lipoteichoic acid biosynthesis protein DltD [Agrilactobacillus yilanensis]|uniref:Protein DltD n=1 Tax=Agrilactobacillus yilanensis TaxID=2485997 RepID=A0ABW4J5S3_9LACO|nr:D-alanyl-lipoteichoic acid biosynthesis protein DltD [Agrilactobacillus yilanensis]